MIRYWWLLLGMKGTSGAVLQSMRSRRLLYETRSKRRICATLLGKASLKWKLQKLILSEGLRKGRKLCLKRCECASQTPHELYLFKLRMCECFYNSICYYFCALCDKFIRLRIKANITYAKQAPPKACHAASGWARLVHPRTWRICWDRWATSPAHDQAGK